MKIASSIFFIFFWLPGIAATAADSIPSMLNSPVQITAEADPIEYASVSADGKYLVYVSRREQFTDLWLRSANPSVVFFPRRLTEDPAEEATPAISPDGRFVAYVGTGYDVKGDIYLLDLREKQPTPLRLTDRETEDGAPSFSRDGRRIYFHRKKPDDPIRRIAFMEIGPERTVSRPIPQVQTIPFDGDAAFPSVSPDGFRIAFISYQTSPSGTLFVLDLKTNTAAPLTSGPYPDFFPAWSNDGTYLLFTRNAYDTNSDGMIDTRDNAAIFRISVDDAEPHPYPLTSARFSCSQPIPIPNGFYFLSNRKGVSNAWFLPPEGEVPNRDHPLDQLNLADRISADLHRDSFLAHAAYGRVLERYPNRADVSAPAAYRLGNLLLKMNMPDEADHSYQRIIDRYPGKNPESDLSAIQQIVIQTTRRIKTVQNESDRSLILQEGISRLSDIVTGKDPFIVSGSRIERARLLMEFSGRSSDLLLAIRFTEDVIGDAHSAPDQIAQAMVIKGDIYARIGKVENVYPIYLSILKTYPGIDPWADAALKRLLDLVISQKAASFSGDTIGLFRKIADDNRKEVPILSAGALNRIGDLYYEAGEWSKAKSAYEQVLEQFPTSTPQTAAARLALAEILYKEERFRSALDLYEKEIRNRPEDDRIYALARRGYIQKSIEGGKYLFQLGEIHTARKVFKEMIDFDDTIVAAHRGYIQCAAAQQDLKGVLRSYRVKMKKNPNDAVAVYAVALILTYLEDQRSLEEAKALLLRAITINGQIEYFHQTLGYIQEVLETAFHRSGRLETALDSYQKAYFLNDPVQNPSNHADLLLNLGNVYFLLGQNAKAFHFFSERLNTGKPFPHSSAAVLFYKRLGMSAFHVRESEKTINAFEKAIELIDKGVNQPEVSHYLDRNHRYVMDQILPAVEQNGRLSGKVKEIAEQQSETGQSLSGLIQHYAPPPSTEWRVFQKGVEKLIDNQEKINDKAILLLKGRPIQGASGRPDPEEAQRMMTVMTSKAKDAVRFSEKMIGLKAELLDRLGLVYQDSGAFEKGVAAFEKTMALNENLGQFKNLSRNKRSIAYNRYLLANTLSGDRRRAELRKAITDFQETLSLLDRYGVPDPSETGGKGLQQIDLRMAVDESDTTEAGKGFSKEQEKRLAESFIARISLELGDVNSAEKALMEQLAFYQTKQQISDRDAFGVSLLYHRAGHINSAKGDWTGAFNHFRQSAVLSLQIKNTANAAISAVNMAKALSILFVAGSEHIQFERELESIDNEVLYLFSQPALAPPKPAQADYHNALGFYLARHNRMPKSDLKHAATAARLLQRAGIHFAAGIRLLEGEATIRSRKEIALYSSLNLNMAAIALDMGDMSTAYALYEKALALSEAGLLPDIRWRALIGLGRPDEAIKVLESITILRAGCSEGEIIEAFEKKAADLIAEKRFEEAFNWIERLSDIERFHRLASLINPFSENERLLFRKIFTQLNRIHELKREISSPDPQGRRLFSQQLKLEEAHLQDLLGKNNKNIPDLIRLLPEQKFQEQAMMLVGIASEAESAADDYVQHGRPADLLMKYEKLVAQYKEQIESALASAESDSRSNPISLFGPQRFEAVDVMDHLPEGTTFIRLFQFKHGQRSSEKRALSFILDPDRLGISFWGSISEALSNSKIQKTGNHPVYIAYDHLDELSPEAIEAANPDAFVLSAGHFIRSAISKKPFKRSVFAIPELSQPFRAYEVLKEPDPSDPESDRFPQGFHTLILSAPVSLTHTVPTRPGESAIPSAVVDRESGKRTDIFELLGRLSQSSLSIVSNASPGNAYWVGHLFSIFGCPTIILALTPDADGAFVNSFLDRYSQSSALEAIRGAKAPPGGKSHWLLLGNPGMSPGDATVFARKHFIAYVQKAKKAYENQAPAEALLHFENAILIGSEADSFETYRPALYQYARESAHQAGNREKALYYAQALVQWLGGKKSGTDAHAEALLRLGLLQAQSEMFNTAVETLNRSLGIYATLNMTPRQIEALSGLGVVSEQATEYDRALSFFQSAASLSRSSDQRDHLARQYTNIGRLHDLRLSNYIPAIENYQIALSLYREMNTGNQKRADISQSLLNIGRCHRLLGNLIQAEKTFDEALSSIGPESLHPELYTKIVIEQANNAWYRANYEDAFKKQRTALRIAREKNLPLLQVVSLNTAGLLWWTLGENQKALDELKEALSLAETLRVREDEIATTLNNIGFVRREMGHYQEALKYFDEAITIDRRLKSRWALAYDFRHKGVTLARMGDIQRALPLLKSALEEAAAIGNRINESRSQLDLGDAFFAGGNFREAETAYQAALSLSRSIALREVEWRALYGLAMLRLPGKPDEAKPLLIEAMDMIETIRSNIRLSQLKDSFLTNKLAVYETLCRLFADSGDAEKAFEIAERSRSRNFIDLLGNQRLTLSRTVDQQLYQRQLKQNEQIEELTARLLQVQNSNDRRRYEAALASAKRELNTLMLEIQSKNPQLGSLVSVEPMSAKELVKIVEPDTALLDYYILNEELFCWLIQSNGIRLFRTPINREVLGSSILDYRRRIQNLEPFEDLSKLLFKKLLSPVSKHLDGIKMLGIIPYGYLHYLSFATLSDGNDYLIDRFPLFYLPSAGVFKYTMAKRVAQKKLRVLAIGNPDLGDPAFDLPFSEYEVHSMKWNFPDITILTQERATEKWVVDNIGKFGIIHLASHGEFNPINPLFSSVKLARDIERDGNLEAAEIFGLNIDADIVVLSACQTGLGKVTQGDDVIGLTRAFLYAGTHTLISSLWRVSDISTAILIKEFYRQYAQTAKGIGLRNAVLHVKNRYPHPGYWGAFTLIGDYY
ncbi:MAG: CHAT domain-containing protein [Pseudomonadota bacterium]